MPVVLIAGPPCAGKSTLALELAAPGDLVVDRDVIARALGSTRLHMHAPAITAAAERQVRADLGRLHRLDPGQTAYVVRCLPRAADREQLARRLRATVRLVDPGLAECLRRAGRDGRPPGTHAAIRQWYRRAAEAPTPTGPRSPRVTASARPCMDCGASTPAVRCQRCCERLRAGRPWRTLCATVRAEETHCWVCSRWVDQDLHAHHPRSATVDHVVQLRDGGPAHERTNVRLAHRGCNTARANRLRGGRQALIVDPRTV